VYRHSSSNKASFPFFAFNLLSNAIHCPAGLRAPAGDRSPAA
jgi:hypothetical protein